ncbi:MAG: cell division protein ZapE [Rhodospirillaceae bacterium]|nr:cell division protein ZapE [Rhodospirillaceae bacterium]
MNDRPTEAAASDVAGSAVANGPRAAYAARIAADLIQPDPAQTQAVARLQALHEALADYVPARPRGSFLGRLFGRDAVASGPPDSAPRGIYLVGDVGCGKSMLMDMFFADAPVAAKRRVHFLAFMQEVHGRIHAWRQSHQGDPVPPIAEAVAADATLLCFDEFQVTNIADAMLLGRLFEALIGRGVVIVATSNRAPQRLYEGGLQRERFLPFIALIEAHLDLVDIGRGTDWRRIRVAGQPVYFVPHDERAAAQLREIFALLTDRAEPKAVSIEFLGRVLFVPRAAEGVAWFGFDALCRQNLGAADYLALAANFHTLLLEDVPVMGDEERNEALRFVALIDALYEHRTLLVMSAEAEPDGLCRARDVAATYRRTASRLIEMRSAEYVARHHQR